MPRQARGGAGAGQGGVPGLPGASEPFREDDTLSGVVPIGGAGGTAKDNEDKTVERRRDVIVPGPLQLHQSRWCGLGPLPERQSARWRELF